MENIINKNMKNNTKGFSLIELSIVLIIIGLLIAGITGGASLIKSAELRATISEIRNYQTAVNAFYTEQGYLPGTNSGSTNQMILARSGEAWEELFNAKITDFDASPTSGTFTVIANENSPKGRMKGSAYVLGYVSSYLNTVNANSLMLVGDGTDVITAVVTNGAFAAIASNTSLPILKPAIAEQIDSKMDDGKPATGKVLALGASGTAAAGACQSTATTAAYNTTVTTNACGLAFKLGV